VLPSVFSQTLVLFGSAKVSIFIDFPNLRRKKFSFLTSSSAIPMSRFSNGVQRYREDFQIWKGVRNLFSSSFYCVPHPFDLGVQKYFRNGVIGNSRLVISVRNQFG
jgi:hypothetical protein